VHASGLTLLVWPATLSADYSHAAIPLATRLADSANLPAALTYVGGGALSLMLLRRAKLIELGRQLTGGSAEGHATAATTTTAAAAATAAAATTAATAATSTAAAVAAALPAPTAAAPPAAAAATGAAVREARGLLWWWLLLLLAYAPASHVVAPLAFVVAEI